MSKPYLIDSHCHIHNTEMWNERTASELIAAAHKNGIKKMIVIGTSVKDSELAKKFALEHVNEGVFWSYGLHPSVVDETLDWNFKKYRDEEMPNFKKERPVAIGEVGLDYHFEPFNKNGQIELFESQIDLAIRFDLPLIFHVRDAYPDFYAALDNFSSSKLRGVVHSFCGNKKDLKKCLERGFYIGVNGMATYSTLPEAPLERMLLETDAPFLAPIPHRGEQNEPAYILNIAEWAAEKYGVDFDEIARVTTKNSEELFEI